MQCYTMNNETKEKTGIFHIIQKVVYKFSNKKGTIPQFA